MASAISTVVYEINTAVLLEEMISMFLRKNWSFSCGTNISDTINKF